MSIFGTFKNTVSQNNSIGTPDNTEDSSFLSSALYGTGYVLSGAARPFGAVNHLILSGAASLTGSETIKEISDLTASALNNELVEGERSTTSGKVLSTIGGLGSVIALSTATGGASSVYAGGAALSSGSLAALSIGTATTVTTLDAYDSTKRELLTLGVDETTANKTALANASINFAGNLVGLGVSGNIVRSGISKFAPSLLAASETKLGLFATNAVGNLAVANAQDYATKIADRKLLIDQYFIKDGERVSVADETTKFDTLSFVLNNAIGLGMSVIPTFAEIRNIAEIESNRNRISGIAKIESEIIPVLDYNNISENSKKISLIQEDVNLKMKKMFEDVSNQASEISLSDERAIANHAGISNTIIEINSLLKSTVEGTLDYNNQMLAENVTGKDVDKISRQIVDNLSSMESSALEIAYKAEMAGYGIDGEQLMSTISSTFDSLYGLYGGKQSYRQDIPYFVSNDTQAIHANLNEKIKSGDLFVQDNQIETPSKTTENARTIDAIITENNSETKNIQESLNTKKDIEEIGKYINTENIADYINCLNR